MASEVDLSKGTKAMGTVTPKGPQASSKKRRKWKPFPQGSYVV